MNISLKGFVLTLLNSFEYKLNENDLTLDIGVKETAPEYINELLTYSLDSDDAYKKLFMFEALEVIMKFLDAGGNIKNIRLETFKETFWMEYDLQEWVTSCGSEQEKLKYLDRAIQENKPNNIQSALEQGQMLERLDVAHNVLYWIKTHAIKYWSPVVANS